MNRVTSAVACGVCSVLLLACDSPSAPDPVLWQGELTADAGAPVAMAGIIAMVAGTHVTQIGIGVSEAPADASLRWLVREGSCNSAGAAIAPASAFPTLTTSSDGNASAETEVRRRLSTGPSYVAEVWTAANDTRLACGDLARVQ